MENNLVRVSEVQFWTRFRPSHRKGESAYGDEVYYCTPMRVGRRTKGGERHIRPDGTVLYYFVK